ncbi:hypothetical protein KXW53_006510, partial [Aspergillus fumigatus]
MIVRANVPGSGSGWRGAHSVWGRKGTWSLAPSRARRAGRPSKPAPACPPVPSARAAHRSLRQGARARPISAAGSVCLSVYRDGWIGSSLAGYGWVGVCVSPRMDAAGGPCRHPVPTRARARRPTGHLWRLPCPSGCLSTRCRSLARAGQLVLAAARSPARLPLLLLLALLALLALPSSPSRARLSARLEGARLPGPLLHIPTDLARPIIVRANVPGSERRSGGRPTCAGRPRAARAAMCPSQLVTAL